MLRSIAIIPDGNRRYCKKKRISLEEGYKKSIDKIFRIVKWCKEMKIKSLIIWGFSTENWKRNKLEREVLFKLFEEKAKQVLDDERIDKEKIKIRILGETNKFSKRLRDLFERIEQKTKKYGRFNLNILLSYGGRREIVEAVNKIISKGRKKITEKEFKKYLWVQENPDLIIRTGGELRLSGFIPFQSTYSELFFTRKYFPEFTKTDFEKVIENYKKRQRRFGR